MATYLKGVTDYIPQIQPWAPDYNFYQNALERKQTSYDKGWDQTNSIYNSILNAPMMRGQNVDRRDNFFKDIEGQIQQMSSVDLSLQQNVDAAASVFKPFYENEDIVHDIAYTRKYQDQLQHADYLKNCVDKDKCGGKYWPGGQRLLKYKAQDFVNATDEDALRMQAPSFTNYINVMDKATKAMDAAGDGKWEMVEDRLEGGWIVQTKNGKQQISTLKNFMTAQFGDDPEVNEFFGAKAQLMGYEEPEKLINIYELEKLRSEATSQEELDFMVKERSEKSRFDAAIATIDKKAVEEKSGLDMMVERQAILEGIITSEGVLPGSDDAQQYKDLQSGIPIKEAAVKKTEELAMYVGNMQYTDEDGNKVSTNVINNVVANALKMNAIGVAATTLSTKNYSRTMKVNPYAMVNYKHSLDVIEADRTAERTNAESTLKYIRDRGAAENANSLEIQRRNVIDSLTIGKGMRHDGTTYKGLSSADALTVYREIFALKNNTGIPYYDGPAKYDDGSTSTKPGEKAVDTRLVDVIDDAINGNTKEGDAAAVGINDVNQTHYNDAFLNASNAEGEASQYTNSKMQTLVRTVIDPADENQKIAAQGIRVIGDLILDQKNKKTSKYQSLVMSDKWEKYFENFPNSLNNEQDGLESLLNLNNDKAIANISSLIGSDKIISVLNNSATPITVMDKKDKTLIDTEALGVISHEEADKLMSSPLDPISGEDPNTEKEKQLLFDYVTKTDSIKTLQTNNFLYSLTTDHDAKQLTRIAFNKKNSEDMFSSINLSIDSWATVYGQETNGEDDGEVRSFMRKNIIQSPTPNKRVVSTRQDLYSAIAAEGSTLLDSYKDKNITAGIQPSLSKIENDNDYSIKDEQGNSIPLMLQGDALKGVISTADIPIDINSIDYNQLYQDNNIPVMIPGKVQDQGKTGWSTAGTETFNAEPMWRTLMNDSRTEVVREGNDIQISSPYIKTQGNAVLLNTNDIEVHEGVQDMFNEVNDQYGNIVAGFGTRMQDVPDDAKYLVYGNAGVFDEKGLGSNYNVTSRSISGIKLVPSERDNMPAYFDYVELMEEAQKNYKPVVDGEKNGDAVFLNNVILALKEDYKDEKDMPRFDVDYSPVYGASDLTKIHIKLNSYKDQDWIDAVGQGVTGLKMQDQVTGDVRFSPNPNSDNIAFVTGNSGGTTKTYKGEIDGTYYVKNSQSKIIEKSKPNSYSNVMANIPIGDKYIDDSNKAITDGSTVRYDRIDRYNIQATIIFREYNKANKTTVTRKIPTGGPMKIKGTDWEFIVNRNAANLRLNYKDLKDMYRRDNSYITNPAEL
jgi:hypothetical protein